MIFNMQQKYLGKNIIPHNNFKPCAILCSRIFSIRNYAFIIYEYKCVFDRARRNKVTTLFCTFCNIMYCKCIVNT